MDVSIRSLVRSILKEVVEPITFEVENTAAYAGQSNFRMYLMRGSKRVAYMDYIIFQGEASISMIEVFRDEDKRKGYGRMLVDKLANDYRGYENIDWGMMTPDGYALRQSMDQQRGFDREEHENKHYKKEEMLALIKAKSLDAARFFVDLTELGDKKTWEKWGEYLNSKGYPRTIDGLDLNDLQDLSAWTRDSVNNPYPPDREPNDWIDSFVAELRG